MSGETPWQSIVDVIIPDRSGQSVLTVDDGGARLPRASIAEFWRGDVDAICDAMCDRFGLRTTVLRVAYVREEEALRQTRSTYVLELRSLDEITPAGTRWLPAGEIDRLVDPEQRTVVGAHFAEQASGTIPPLRQPWNRVGWLDDATAWMTAELTARGMPPIGRIVQAKHWSISSVLRANTAQGAFYFKETAVLPLFVNEPVVVTELARRFPANVPAPIAIDATRRWMLMADFGKPIGSDGPLEAREDMLRTFGAIQRECAAHVDALLALGCIDRRLKTLPAYAAGLAEGVVELAALTDDERAQFTAALPRIAEMCAALAGCGVPETLVHSDLHLNNVARNGEHPVFFDWSDACITHPFFDLMSVFDEKDAATQTHLRDVYFATWRAYAAEEQLNEAWRLAMILSDLHQAISYQYIRLGLEPISQTDFGGAAAHYVRNILKALG